MTLLTIATMVEYAGNGATVAFPTTFKFSVNSEVVVTEVDDGTLVETVKTMTTHYLVTGRNTPTGGTVTMLVAPAAGKTLRIERVTPLTQTTDLRTQAAYNPEVIETALDHLEQQIQELEESTSSFLASVTDIEGRLDIIEPQIVDILERLDIIEAQIVDILTRLDALELITSDFNRLQCWTVVLSSHETPFEEGVKAGRFVLPYNFTIVGFEVSVSTAQTSGDILTFDCNVAGASILSTKVTIDNGETSSLTAATPCVLSGSGAKLRGAEISWDIDQVGDGTAIWAQAVVYGYPTHAVAFP